jgi:hypothetical protein
MAELYRAPRIPPAQVLFQAGEPPPAEHCIDCRAALRDEQCHADGLNDGPYCAYCLIRWREENMPPTYRLEPGPGISARDFDLVERGDVWASETWES